MKLKSIYTFFCLSLFAANVFAVGGAEMTLGQELRSCANDREMLRQKIADSRDAISFTLAPDVSEWEEGSGEKKLNVTAPGTLKELLGEEMLTVESLTLTGTLSESDVTTLWQASLNGKLAVINLTDATIEENRIADSAFWHAEDQIVDDNGSGFVSIWYPKLKTIKFPETLEEIGKDAFSYCHALEEITLPSALREIGKYCFYNCTSLSNPALNFPEGITEIHEGTFQYCQKLAGEVSFPSSLRKIENFAFYSTRFTDIHFSEGLEEIGMQALIGCYNLKSIVFPASLKKLGEESCGNWISLEKAYCAASIPPVCEGNPFGDGMQTPVLYVPEGTASLYAVAAGWDFFKTIIDTEPIPGASLNGISKTDLIPDSRIFNLNGIEITEPEIGKIYIKGGKLIKF